MKSNIIKNFLEFTNESITNGLPTDSSLSVNQSDRNQQQYIASLSRLNSILSNIWSSIHGDGYLSNYDTDEQKVTDLVILRIYPKQNINLNVYVTFKVLDKEYYGVIENFTDKNPNFKSEVFKDPELYVTKEWRIKTSGIIIKAIRNWMVPDKGIYKAMKDIQCRNSVTGNMEYIKQYENVEVLKSFDNKILIKKNTDTLQLSDFNYYYFNYWFEKVDNKE